MDYSVPPSKIKIIRWKQLREKLGGKEAPSKTAVWRWERDGLFPKRIKIGPNTSAWFEDEVDNYLLKRAIER